MNSRLDEVLAGFEKEKELKNLKAFSQNVSKKYIDNFSSGRPLVQTEKEALSYAFMRMKATAAATKFAFSKIENKQISSVLDLGSGTGAALIAAEEALGYVSKIDAVELEKNMLELNKEFVKEYDENLFSKISYFCADATKFDFQKDYDLVVASYFMNELKREERLKLSKKMWEKTRKYLVIVEPGTPKHHREMMELKNFLVSCGANLVSPCKCKDCPFLKTEDWCHFSVRVQRSRMHKELKNGNLGYEDEKFCYLVFSRDVQEETKEKIVIRKPVHGKGRVQVKSCTSGGILLETISKSNKDLYKIAKDFGVGDEF